MNGDRFHQVDEIFHRALQQRPEERAAFLEGACAHDPSLIKEVEALLRSDERAGNFLEPPAVDPLAKVVPPSSGAFAGNTFGPYEVQILLGVGGMGEVYRARDSKLKRDVAIKVLPHEFSSDVERVSRFQREAEILASLNHPHIGAIYDLERFGEWRFLVLEFVDGETLDQRISGGVIPVGEALAIAKQIAEALDAAHEKGIIHRDLKPSNIKVTPRGNVKILDFGLAKVVAAEGTALSNLPTTLSASTRGSILGTPAYMSPEQANGKEADRSSDLWAFGCVLYEMLTGRRAFQGETTSEILAAVLKSDPDWSRLPTETPEGIRRLLRHCLQKDQTLRLRDARDARIEINDVQSGPPPEQRMMPTPAPHRERLLWVSALALISLIVAVLAVRALRPAAPVEIRFEINTPPTRDYAEYSAASVAISPDGQKIVFVAGSGVQSQLWLRSLMDPLAQPLAGTQGAKLPFWSPDSKSIGFFADAKLKRLDLDTGSTRTLAAGFTVPIGGAWNSNGVIIFSPSPSRSLLRTSAEGAEPVAVTQFQAPQQRFHAFPQFLPDGNHFLFSVEGSPEARGIYVGQLDGGPPKRLFDGASAVYAAASGQLLFIRDGRLLAQDFDPVRLELKGDPLPVATGVNTATVVSASTAGPIVYRSPSPDSGKRQLVWVDRSGQERDKVIYADFASQGPSLSHDGHRVAIFRTPDRSNMDIWSYEIARGAWTRETLDPGDEIDPLWSPDDSAIVFSSRRRGLMSLYRKLLSAPAGSEELLLPPSPEITWAMDWSNDGRFLIYNVIDPKHGADIWALPLAGGRKPFEVLGTDSNELLPQFSPDGKWMAYQSDKTGRFEIYVQPFPGSGGDSLVSTNGGTQVRWNPNSKELFYIGSDEWLMAVSIRLPSDGTRPEIGAPVPLFKTNVGSTAINQNRQQYMVSSNGQSFVMNSVLEEAGASPITVLLNWKPKR